MATQFVFDTPRSRAASVAPSSVAARAAIVLVGRFLFGAIFLMAAVSHFQTPVIQYAAQAGVPLPGLLVPASGILAFIGALSILTGYRSRLGAWLLVAFLVPVTLSMHAFWNVTDPMMRQMQMAMFMKNVSMLGAALLITQLGTGPLSLGGEGSAAGER